MRKYSTLVGILVAVAVVGGNALAQENKPTASKPAGTTLDNLQSAYHGESNAHERYVAFAKKADEEGFGQVASLFRAAARAEEIHAQAHAEVIKKLGGTPKADIQKPEVKSTKENLEAALKGETYERDTMYPDFLKVAKAEKNLDATKTFNYALAAEGEHAKLYKQALDDLDQWKGGKKEFFVCAVCGYTVTKVDFEKCPSCFSPKEKYEKIS
ncbi:MAG: rubrerythrin family protein [Planctomycetota bacterium]